MTHKQSFVALLLAGLVACADGQALGAGICADALRAAQIAPAAVAEERTFPIVCNWNYLFALEEKMLALKDLKHRRSPKEYHDQIDAAAVILAQRRVGLPETGVVDLTLFVSYMSLP